MPATVVRAAAAPASAVRRGDGPPIASPPTNRRVPRRRRGLRPLRRAPGTPPVLGGAVVLDAVAERSEPRRAASPAHQRSPLLGFWAEAAAELLVVAAPDRGADDPAQAGGQAGHDRGRDHHREHLAT